MSNFKEYKELEREVDKYFAALTEDQFMRDLERADYSFYKNITISILDPLIITYGLIKMSEPSSKCNEGALKNHSKADFSSENEVNDFAMAA
jgi:hypothetical protein